MDPEQIQSMRALLAQCEQNNNPFEILGVSPEADDAEVRKRYRLLNKQNHPDRFRSVGDEAVVRDAQKLFKIINDAYQQIKSATDRQQLAGQASPSSDGMDLQAIFEVERNIEKAAKNIDNGRYQLAAKMLEKAREHDPDHPHIQAYTIFLHFIELPTVAENKRDRLRVTAYIHDLRELSKKEGTIMPYEILIARMYKLQKETKAALEAYRRVVSETNGKHAEAEREIRLLSRRQKAQNEPQQTSLWQRITSLFNR